MNENIIKIAVLVVVLFIASLGAAVSVGLFPSAVEAGSFAYKYIIPHRVNVVEDMFEEIDKKNVDLGIDITVYHDNKRNVTCWVWTARTRGGISCIPDHMLTP